MKVKDVAQCLKITTDELLKLLKNVAFGKSYNEESDLDKELEKKLAKKYGVNYPFKSAAKPAQAKPSVAISKSPAPEKKPTQQGAPKQQPQNNVSKPNNNQRPQNGPKPQGQNNGPKPQGQNNGPKPNNNQHPQNGQKTQFQNNNQNNNQNNKANNNKPAQKPNNNQPTNENKQIVVEEVKTQKLHTLKADEYIESRFDDEYEEKYNGYEDGDLTEGQKFKAKNRTNNNDAHKKAKQKKSRAEKLAGEVKQKLEDHVVYYEQNMTTMDVAEALGISVTELVKKLFSSMGVFASATQMLDRDTVELIASEYNFEIKDKTITDMVRFDEMTIEDDEKDLKTRPAIVTIMGHVDHGKTTLLDNIRSSHVVTGEAGGITQHIGAYQVEKNGRLITFIDTPGHAAFTEMRARGAQVTDIVILVVAADDGVMPQTKEAIEHAQAAGVPIVVAVNKMDKPTANPDRVKQELMNYNLTPEEWGGDTVYCPISALKGDGVPELLEVILLLSDMKNYRANPNRLAVGTVIEAKLDKGRGPVATLLVQNGTLKVGDVIVVGNTYGKIRAMQDEYGHIVKSAGPAKPVEITGLDEVPCAGEKFMALDDEKKARAIAEIRSQNKQNEEINSAHAASLANIANQAGDLKILNLIIKCDVQGSIEAIRGLLEKITIEGTKINIIGARVGAISDNDISLAVASNAIIIGFNIRPNSQITDLAKEKGIEIRLYNIIYKLQEDIEAAVKGMLDPVYEEVITGEAEVREVFKISKVGTVAGSMVTKGEIKRTGSVRVIRDSIVIYTGKIAGLRRFKDDVKEVKEGFDCGISVENFNDIKVGDRFECFVMEEQERE